MSKITLDNLSDNLKQYLNGLGLTESQVQQLINRLKEEEIGDINNLQTNNKTLVSAINELFQNANNGKELIASAIGEPLDSSDTFSAMSNDINGLLGTFKTNMMKNGVTVDSGDKFKALIDKIATLSDNEGKGLQYTTGFINRTSNLISEDSDSTTRINLTFDQPLDFTPTRLILSIPVLGLSKDIAGNYYMHDVSIDSMFCDNTNGYCEVHDDNINAYVLMYIKNISSTGFTLYAEKSTTNYPLACPNGIYWVALGVEGEEDTTLRDSLANILGDKGVEVSPEDDMATLIGKVDGIQGSSLDIISATELPSTGKQNQICVITDVEPTSYVLTTNLNDKTTNTNIATVYVSNSASYDTITGSLVPITSGNLTTYYYFNKICQGDKRLSSYIYQNNTWKQLTQEHIVLLENGTYVNESYHGQLTVGARGHYYAGEAFTIDTTNTSWYKVISAFAKPFDMTMYNKVKVRAYVNPANGESTPSSSARLFISIHQNSFGYTDTTSSITAGTTYNVYKFNEYGIDGLPIQEFTYDISSLTGNYYLGVGGNTNAYNHIFITDIELY